MRSIGIRELKRGLSGYLAAVKDGEGILVTDRGLPVARIVREPDARLRSLRRSAFSSPRSRLPPQG